MTNLLETPKILINVTTIPLPPLERALAGMSSWSGLHEADLTSKGTCLVARFKGVQSGRYSEVKYF